MLEEYLKNHFIIDHHFTSTSKRVNKWDCYIIIQKSKKYVVSNLLDTFKYKVSTLDGTYTQEFDSFNKLSEFLLTL